MATALPEDYYSKSDDDSDEWDELELCNDAQTTTCLFCPSQFRTLAVALDHCRQVHNFDLLELKQKFNMDCYSYIKMINYIKLKNPKPHEIINATECIWNDECYLKPSDGGTWLIFDFDDLGSIPSTPHYAVEDTSSASCLKFNEQFNTFDPTLEGLQDMYNFPQYLLQQKTQANNGNGDIQKKVDSLIQQINAKDAQIETLQYYMGRMRQTLARIINTEGSKSDADNHKFLKSSEEYFMSYDHYSIHYDMLNDKVRTNSYKDAILNNCELFRNKIVLDVGCGTGILSMFCAQAGAKKVYAIDQSDIVKKANQIIIENKLEDKIQVIRGELESVNLPVQEVDIIVSEWMGYFLLYEGMLNSVIYARNQYLKSDGLILPNRCSISLVGISDIDRHKKYIEFWEDVHGFSMKCMKKAVLQEAKIETIEEDKIITESTIVLDLDLKTCTQNVEILKSFTLTPIKDGELTALVGYFDTGFDLPEKVEFSTGPQCPRTHWDQTVFYLGDIINLQKGHPLDCSISCTGLDNNPRGLSMIISIDDYHYTYKME